MSVARAMYEVQLQGRKRAKDLMLGLNETTVQLATASSVHWYSHWLMREVVMF